MSTNLDAIHHDLRSYIAGIDGESLAILVTDPQVRVQWANEGFYALCGYSLREIQGRHPSKFLHGDKTDPETKKLMRQFIDAEKPFIVEVINYHKNRSSYRNQLKVDPVYDNAGKLIHFIGIQPATPLERSPDESRTEIHQNRRFLKPSSAQKVGHWDLNVETETVTWSPFLYELYHRKFSDGPFNLEESLAFYCPEERPRIESSIKECINSGRPYSLTLKFIRRNGLPGYHYVVAEGHRSPETGKVILISGICQDVTERKIAELEALKRAHELESIKTTLDLKALMSVTDVKGKILWVNDRLCEVSQYKASDLIGKSHRILKSNVHPKSHYKNLWKTLCAGKIWTGEFCNLKRNGDYYWVDTIIYPDFDEKGQPYQFTSIQIDITENKRLIDTLSQSEDRLRNLFESVPIPIWEEDFSEVNKALIEIGLKNRSESEILSYFGKNPQQVIELVKKIKVVNFNQAVLDLHQYSCKEQLKQNFMNELDLNDRVIAALTGQFVAICQDKYYFETLVPYQLPNRKTFQIHLHWVVAKGSEKTFDRVIVPMIDITDRINLETQLRKEKDRALRLSEMKGKFLAQMSHEIRTPLNGIMGVSDLLIDSPLNPDQKRLAKMLVQCSENLLTLVNDVLDFSKIEAGIIDIFQRVFNPHTMLKSLVDFWEPKADEKGLKLIAELDPTLNHPVFNDSVRIQQVVNNLLSNAIKFSDSGEIRLKANLVAEAGNIHMLEVEITDQGCGISVENLKHLFQPFAQFGNKDIKSKGTGLGLAISMELAKLLGGSLRANSTLDSGSTFTLKIPCAFVQPRKSAKALNVSKKTLTREKAKILIVDDIAINCQIAKEMIERSGWTAQTCSSVTEAVHALKDDDFDLILLDDKLPEINGREFAQIIRKNQYPFIPQHIPIIAFTANAFPEDKEKCLNAGMNDFIAKPLKTNELREKILKWINR